MKWEKIQTNVAVKIKTHNSCEISAVFPTFVLFPV